MEYSWVLWRLLGNWVFSLMYVYYNIDPHFTFSLLLYLIWHGSIMFPIMDMIMSIIHGSVVYYFDGHALFLLLSMGMSTLGMLYMVNSCFFLFSHFLVIWIFPCTPLLFYMVKCLIHHFLFWPHTLRGIS